MSEENLSVVSLDALFAQLDTGSLESVPNTWAQGRTVYGGLSAALLLRAIKSQVDSSKLLRALNVAFSAPTLANKAFSIETELLREGKTIAQWQARLIQNDTCCVQINAVFGSGLDSSISINDFKRPEIPAFEDSFQYPQHGGATFTQYFEMAQAQGDFPLSGGSSLDLGGWMRLRETPKIFTDCHLVALIDVWPPATMMHMKELAPGSTVSWTMQFPAPMAEQDPAKPLGYQAHIEYSEGGFGITSAKVWSDSGQLLALSQQTIIVYG